MLTRARIEYEGIVQGVGFRPFLHKAALELGLRGWALNTSAGVLLELEGERAAIEEHLRRMRDEPPPLARVLVTRVQWLAPAGYRGFAIEPSQRLPGELTLVSPDVATCADCVRELFDPADRRYRYPFINCTNCGPRYTIIRALPYDRPQTTMAGFPLCDACAVEYRDVADRRYHAQPVACAACGPALWFETAAGAQVDGDALTLAVELLKRGEVLALKGLGGFHLACRADQDEPVLALRRRKQRSFFKPLAVMVRDLAMARALCRISPAAAERLLSTVAPVVLAPLRTEALGTLISPYVAPRLDRLGVFLPYTPLHHLLLVGLDLPLVMTSGNLSDEPIVADNDQARASFGGLCDGLLLHDRPIQARCDDSVLACCAEGGYTVLRHSRGFAPYPIALPEDGPAVLALGGDIKTSFAASRGHFVFQSPHLGDAEHLPTYAFFRDTWEHYRALFGLQPEAVACDLHPGYHTARWAEELAAEYGVPLYRVQHHHAHLAALMAEHNLAGEQVALTLDGTGYGADGTLWGGEVLAGDFRAYQRVAHLRPFRLAGGEAAVHAPWRTALALLHDAAPEAVDAYCASLLDGSYNRALRAMDPQRIADEADPAFALPAEAEVRLVRGVLQAGGSLAPESTALGRLLDGLAALLGVTILSTYEGQAPMELEALVPGGPPEWVEDCGSESDVLDWRPLVRAVLADKDNVPRCAGMIHAWVAAAFADAAARACAQLGLRTVLASGGCLQSTVLKHYLTLGLRARGLGMVTHRDLPPNDGGLALGILRIAQQLMIGEYRSKPVSANR